MRKIASVLLALLLIAPPALAQKRCKKGVPCGNTCISASKTCHIGSSAPAPAEARVAPPQPGKAVSDSAGQWVGSSRGKTYYKAGCSGARTLAAANLISFKSEDEAQKAGYRRSAQKGC